MTFAISAEGQTPATPGDTALKGGTTIEVIQSYKPEIKQAPKPEPSPSLPPVDTSHPNFKYNVPPQNLFYTYGSLPLRPLALDHDSIKNSFPNYVKGALGNLSTLYLDAGVGGLRGKDYETAFHLHSISQKGSIQYQQSTLSDLQADASYHTSGILLHAGANCLRNQFYYYGYDHDKLNYSNDSLKQTFTGVKLQLDLQNEPSGYSRIRYHPGFYVSSYSDNFKASEIGYGFAVPVRYQLDTTLQIGVNFNGDLAQLKSGNTSTSNNVLSFAPGLIYQKGTFNGSAFCAAAIGQKGGTQFLPDISASLGTHNNSIVFSAGWQEILHQNTYQQLSTENPYIYNQYEVRQTLSSEIFAALNGRVGDHISYSARLGFWHYNDMPLFVNNSYDQKQFNILYDNSIDGISINGQVHYKVSNVFAIGLGTTVFNHGNSTTTYLWGIPTFKLKADLLVRPLPGLSITAYLNMLDGIYAPINGNLNNPDKLKAIFDLGGNVEYDLIKRLSVFVQINNLVNSQNQRWLGYTAYGFNIYGGIRFKF